MHKRIRLLLLPLKISCRRTTGQLRLSVSWLPGRALCRGVDPSTSKTWKLKVEYIRKCEMPSSFSVCSPSLFHCCIIPAQQCRMNKELEYEGYMYS